MAIVYMLKDTDVFDLNTAEEYLKETINEILNENKISSTPKRYRSRSPKR